MVSAPFRPSEDSMIAAMSSPTAVRLAVDMGLEERMNRKELIKLSDQIRPRAIH